MLASAFITQIQERCSHEKLARVFGPLISRMNADMERMDNLKTIRLIRAISGQENQRIFNR